MTQSNHPDYLDENSGMNRRELEEKFLQRSQIKELIDDETEDVRKSVGVLTTQQSEILYRIKEIDGNGSGRSGVLQRLADQVAQGFAQINERIDEVQEKTDVAISRIDRVEGKWDDENGKKTLADYFLEKLSQSKGIKIILAIGGVCAPLAAMLGLWVALVQQWRIHHPTPPSTTVVLPAPISPTPAIVPTAVPNEQPEPKHKHH